jgi:hypothetical protein
MKQFYDACAAVQWNSLKFQNKHNDLWGLKVIAIMQSFEAL